VGVAGEQDSPPVIRAHRDYNPSLLLATNGNFYGTTSGDGTTTPGTVFEITPQGMLTTLYTFHYMDGAYPVAGLVQSTDGNFYGATANGGISNLCFPGCGTIFKITPGGTLTTLHSFDSIDGADPFGTLIETASQDFYGTTQQGGAHGWGTIFRITPTGAITILHDFAETDGAYPYAGLTQATGGDFFEGQALPVCGNGGPCFRTCGRRPNRELKADRSSELYRLGYGG
jgi:uncharacterized repeat protein (TIGR03803 family)